MSGLAPELTVAESDALLDALTGDGRYGDHARVEEVVLGILERRAAELYVVTWPSPNIADEFPIGTVATADAFLDLRWAILLDAGVLYARAGWPGWRWLELRKLEELEDGQLGEESP